jgi:hypothetical protein
MFVNLGFIINEDAITDDQMELYIPQELRHEWKEHGGIRPTEAGLERIDYILPRLLKLSSNDDE